MRFGIQVRLDLDGIQDARFDSTVRADIQLHESAQDLTAVARKSLESLSRIHDCVRTLTELEVNTCTTRWDEILQTAQSQIGHLVGLEAIAREDGGTIRDRIAVFSDLTKRVREMRSRYKNLKFCSGWYVSGGLGT